MMRSIQLMEVNKPNNYPQVNYYIDNNILRYLNDDDGFVHLGIDEILKNVST